MNIFTSSNRTPLKIFLKLCPFSIFESRATNANDEMKKDIQERIIQESTVGATNEITRKDILTYFAMRLSLLSKSANSTIREKYKYEKEAWWLGLLRFFIVSKYSIANLSTLNEQLSKRFAEAVSPSAHLCIDESLFEFLGFSEVRRTIPRKPHSIGHLAFLIASILHKSKKPYVHFMYPICSKYFNTEVEHIVLYLVDQLAKYYDIRGKHLIFDAAFTSISLLKKLLDRIIYCTASVSLLRLPVWWPVIERKVPKKTGRTFIDKDCFIWNMYRKDNKTVYKAVSTSFDVINPIPDHVEHVCVNKATRTRNERSKLEQRKKILIGLKELTAMMKNISDTELRNSVSNKIIELENHVKPVRIVESKDVKAIIGRISRTSHRRTSSTSRKAPLPSSSTNTPRSPSSSSKERQSFTLRYRVKWIDGKTSIVNANQFASNHEFCYHFIQFAEEDDWKQCFTNFSLHDLKEFCKNRSLSQSKSAISRKFDKYKPPLNIFECSNTYLINFRWNKGEINCSTNPTLSSAEEECQVAKN